ncbi:nose resistant to fluoxetine protein 6 [Biomphalaria pfeifferi]|uniref:Nose resistant to fluoxetine protein 6 n=1 Tax=Biomphalaria pfeifferi TaxID=112525 RepID=A0AAD8FDK8_BIOPF|nr:nose resistant to fluoxetine protein 6 [Biomphalaria pfeifferi]
MIPLREIKGTPVIAGNTVALVLLFGFVHVSDSLPVKDDFNKTQRPYIQPFHYDVIDPFAEYIRLKMLKAFLVGTKEEPSYSSKLKSYMDQFYSLSYNVSQLCRQHFKIISEDSDTSHDLFNKFFTSNGKQANEMIFNNKFFMGNFEQCEKIDTNVNGSEPVRGRYTHFSLSLRVHPKIDSTLPILWYICLPRSCTVEDSRSVAKTFQNHFQLDSVRSEMFEQRESADDNWYHLAVTLLVCLAVVCFIATAVDSIGVLRRKVNTIWNSHDLPRSKQAIACHILMSFSLRRSVHKTFGADDSEECISCLHGLRVISLIWVFAGSVFYIVPTINNPLRRYFIITSRIANIVYSPFPVDTFFLISGCLVAYNFLNRMKNLRNLESYQMIKYYTHRFLRLTPLFALVMVIYTGITPYLEHGPFVRQDSNRYNECRLHWWRNLFYISNLFDFSSLCMPWSWYLQADMQFYALAPLFIVPVFYGFRRVGVSVIILMVLCHILSTAVILKSYEDWDLQSHEQYLTHIYIKPWTRVGPYAFGLLLGYLLSDWGKDIKISKLQVRTGWLIATLVFMLMLSVRDNVLAEMFGVQAFLQLRKISSYTVLKSSLWSVTLGWIVFACFSGNGGVVNSFLTWEAWAPLSKLSYGAYLCHALVILYINHNQYFEEQFTYTYAVQKTIFVTVYANFLSLVLTLMIDTPIRNLVRPFTGWSPTHRYQKVHSESQEETVLNSYVTQEDFPSFETQVETKP